TRPCSRRLAMWLTRPGGPVLLASTGSGATAGLPWARSSPEPRPTPSAFSRRSGWSPRSPPHADSSSHAACMRLAGSSPADPAHRVQVPLAGDAVHGVLTAIFELDS